MITNRQLFLQHIGQTSESPMLLEVEKAKGAILYTSEGNECIDLISGISVCNLGHCHPKVVEAIQKQAAEYMHLMVYGEFVQTPQVKLAEKLCSILPQHLNNVFFVNSGSEATEGALKLAKRFTGRSEIVSFKNAYHGSTHGALSIIGSEEYKQNFRPLCPGTRQLEFNNILQLQEITKQTACVIIEPIQGEAGIVEADHEYLTHLRKRCDEVGALLIFDEVQTAFGRTGKMFGFEHYNIYPDIINFAKGFGGGMPLGAFVSSKEIMDSFTSNPMLGHITTFGGHPVCCAAGLASLTELIENTELIETAQAKGELFKKRLKHNMIKSVHGKGLFLSVTLHDKNRVYDIVMQCLKDGVLIDYFLFCEDSFRISAPLIISEKQIEKACAIILNAFEEINC